jgi:hypothetical protein
MVARIMIVLAIGGGLSGCRSVKPTQGAEQSSSTPDPSVRPVLPSRDSNKNVRRLLLGRVVNMSSMTAELNVTGTPPDEELTDESADFAAVMFLPETVKGIRLSSGSVLWTKELPPPCNLMAVAGRHVYVSCRSELISLSTTNGEAKQLDHDWDGYVSEVKGSGSVVIARFSTGIVTLFDAKTNERLARGPLRALARASGHRGIVVAPERICSYGLHWKRRRSTGWVLEVGCADWRLSTLWSKEIPFTLAPQEGQSVPEPINVIRQEGPHHLVLNTSMAKVNGEEPGKSLLVRWRDGAILQADDHTFFTIEDARGERFVEPAVLDEFTRPVCPHPGKTTSLTTRFARVASDGHRAYVLIIDDRLVGIDLQTRRRLFNVVMPVGMALDFSLELVDGFPIVRTKLENPRITRASIYDPLTGTLLYDDARPSE